VAGAPAVGTASTPPGDQGRSPRCPEWIQVNDRGSIFSLLLGRETRTGGESKAKYPDAGA